MNTAIGTSKKRGNWAEIITLLFLLIGLSASFLHGYFIDKSKPVGGTGWADQSTYYKVAKKIATGQNLEKSDFHYQMGYPLLGATFLFLGVDEPYAYVSYFLMMFSAVFLFYGARQYFPTYLTVLFVLLIFFRLGDVRALEYAAEIFMIPWNNQVLFFCSALYFYAFSRVVSYDGVEWPFLVFMGLVTGWTVGTREESILFLGPLLVFYLYKVSASWYRAGSVFMLVALAYSPNVLFKYWTFGVFFENVRFGDQGVGYIDMLLSYTHYTRFLDNVVDVVFNSSYRGIDSGGRLAILQANPWFWVAPVGMVLMMYGGNRGLVVYVAIMLTMFLFYLSGENMSIQKLQFHCLRYVSFSWIVFSLFTVYFIDWTINAVRSWPTSLRTGRL